MKNKCLSKINQQIVLFISFLCLFRFINTTNELHIYSLNRNRLLDEEAEQAFGANITLNKEEKVLNEILMKYKHEEVDYGLNHPEHFNFSKPYFEYRDGIKFSKVYQIIKRMPKGGALHIHGTLMMDAEYLLKLTYEDFLYACIDPATTAVKFKYSKRFPKELCSSKWKYLKDLRKGKSKKEVRTFDNQLKKYFTMYTDNDADLYSAPNAKWEKFIKVYSAMKSLIMYRPVREKYLYDALTKFYNDGIIYIEIRSGIHKLYELNGTEHAPMHMIKVHKEVTKNFQRTHPDFLGVKFILTKRRKETLETMRKTLFFAKEIKRVYPDFFAGFDIVGPEDEPHPLKEFIPELKKAKPDINYFFHAGETNWFGTNVDENLVDAILLEPKRIGHAYALVKHPTLIQHIKQKNIGLEISVISNTILGLVRDVRNHPLATYLAMSLPIVLSSDDPGAWGADPLSHDFYVAFVGVASRKYDIRMLKQLAENSIFHSSLTKSEQVAFHVKFIEKWDQFIREEITKPAHVERSVSHLVENLSKDEITRLISRLIRQKMY